MSAYKVIACGFLVFSVSLGGMAKAETQKDLKRCPEKIVKEMPKAAAWLNLFREAHCMGDRRDRTEDLPELISADACFEVAKAAKDLMVFHELERIETPPDVDVSELGDEIYHVDHTASLRCEELSRSSCVPQTEQSFSLVPDRGEPDQVSDLKQAACLEATLDVVDELRDDLCALVEQRALAWCELQKKVKEALLNRE